MKQNPQTTSEFQYSFLPTRPSGNDLFKNQSQNKIASVIAEKIMDDPNFRIIGIDGTWGSGKSNLVELLKDKLKDDYRLFIYDVWGHQEDEQRKAILVELTDFLIDHNNQLISNKKNWRDKLKILLANTKETTTINHPYLSLGFLISLLAIVYVPTINVSLKDYLQVENVYGKIIITTLPILIVMGIFLRYLIFNWWQSKDFRKSIKKAAGETFQVYTNKQKEETKIETITDDLPSVRDFQNWMDEIDRDLNKKVVIVFDNFDRLPQKHILNIWSSIHIFFAEKSYKNIKVVLPFDREHVQHAFKDLNPSENSHFANDYINKTFDIVFRVPLPIMSDWKQFFRVQWKNAFGFYEEHELEKVIQVYEFLNHKITPREIIAFINEILTIKYLDVSYKERYIAIFILCKASILQSPIKSIVNLAYLNGLESLYQGDKDFPKQLTAIIYHIDVESALELIYTEELKNALNKDDVEQFNDICKSDFINDIFYNVINELEELSNPIKTLNKINKENSLSEYELNQAWTIIYKKVLAKSEQPKELKIEEWQTILLQKSKDDLYMKSLFDGYYKLLTSERIMEFTGLVDQLASELDKDRTLRQLSKKMIPPAEFVKLVEEKGETYSDYELICGESDLDKYLSNLPVADVLKLKNTDILTSKYRVKGYQKALIEHLKQPVQQNDILSANDILLKLKETVQEHGQLAEIIADDRVSQMYVNNQSPDLPIIPDLIALRIARGSSYHSSYAGHFTTVLDSEDDKLTSAIGNTILDYISYDDLLLLAPQFKSSKLYKAVILYLFNGEEHIRDGYTANKIIENYEVLCQILEIKDATLLDELENWSIIYEDVDLNKIPQSFLSDCLKYSENKIAKGIISIFNERFASYEATDMKSLFKDEKNIYNKYFKNLNDQSLNQTSLNTFSEVLNDSLKEGKSKAYLWGILEKYEASSQLSIQNLLKDIRDDIYSSNIDLTVEMALKLVPHFLNYNLLTGENDLFRKILKVGFLENPDFVKFLQLNSEKIKPLYKAAEAEDRSGFKNTIIENMEEESAYAELAKSLGINTEKET